MEAENLNWKEELVESYDSNHIKQNPISNKAESLQTLFVECHSQQQKQRTRQQQTTKTRLCSLLELGNVKNY